MIKKITHKGISKKSGKFTPLVYSNYKENVDMAKPYSV